MADAITANEVRKLGIGNRRIVQLIAEDALGAPVKINSRWRFERQAILDYIATHGRKVWEIPA
jgi:hypothetical protein